MVPESQASTATFRKLKKLKIEDGNDDLNGGKLSVKLEKQSTKKIAFGDDIVHEIVKYKKDVEFFDDEDDFIDNDDDEDEDDVNSVGGKGIASARSRRTTTAKKENVISSDEDMYESDDSFEPDFI